VPEVTAEFRNELTALYRAFRREPRRTDRFVPVLFDRFPEGFDSLRSVAPNNDFAFHSLSFLLGPREQTSLLNFFRASSDRPHLGRIPYLSCKSTLSLETHARVTLHNRAISTSDIGLRFITSNMT
jgi:hypothetical protein